MPRVKLNPEQEKAVDLMVKGYTEASAKGFTLTGEGGTGKTTCVMDAVAAMVKAGARVMLAAPTNKAVKQLEKSAAPFRFPPEKVFACTLAKSLGLALLPSGEEKKVKKVGRTLIPDFDVMVMDEASMVSKYALHERILPEVDKAGVYLIVVGDTWQLPPVKETESVAFGLYDGVNLTAIERFTKESGIGVVTHGLRSSLIEDRPFVFSGNAGTAVETVLPVDFTKRVVEAFHDNVDDTRALAWTNAKVDAINSAVRTSIYGPKANRFEVGERVVTGAPIFDSVTDEMVVGTDEECIVKAVTDSVVYEEHSGKEYETHQIAMQPVYADPVTVFCHVVHERSAEALSRDLDALKVKARTEFREWYWFHKLKDLFSDIRYCYCITVHRSQGSTYDTVLVDVPNILRNRSRSDRNRLLYVACSRASRKLVLGSRKIYS